MGSLCMIGAWAATFFLLRCFPMVPEDPSETWLDLEERRWPEKPNDAAFLLATPAEASVFLAPRLRLEPAVALARWTFF